MDDQNLTMLDYIFKYSSGLLVPVFAFFNNRQTKIEESHEKLKEDMHNNYTRKEEFLRAVDKLTETMDRNTESINRKLDSLFIPKADQ